MESPHARAVAHYKWAARYKRKKHLNKARAHLFRGDHYMRASAFGAPQEFHVGKLIVGSSDHGEFEVVGVITRQEKKVSLYPPRGKSAVIRRAMP